MGRDWVNGAVSVAALALAVLGFVRNCSQEDKIDQLSYETMALEHRPLLKIAGNPTVLGFKFSSESISMDTLLNAPIGDSIIDIYGDLTLNLRFAVFNEGNAVAHISAFAVADTTSGDALARRMILSGDHSRMKLLPDSSYYRERSIPPGDTGYFEVDHVVRFSDSGSFTIHFLLLYQNDMSAIFDTYHWARFRTGEMLFRNEYRIHNGQFQFRPVLQHEDERGFLSFVDANESFYAYDRDESRALKRNIRNWVLEAEGDQ